ncbi:MAG: hypothetical protein ABIN55_01995, partial [Aeromicrobium sp.]
MSTRLPRAFLILPVLLLAAFLLRPTPGTAEDLPAKPDVSGGVSADFYQDVYIRGGGIDGATIQMQRTVGGDPLTCKNRVGYDLVVGPVIVEGGGFRCSIPGADLHNPDKSKDTTVSVTVFQVVGGVRSEPAEVQVMFHASRFSMDFDTPPKLATDEPINFSGTREDGQGFNLVRIDWTLKRNGVSLFPERDTDKRSCDAGEQADNQTFTCYYDSENPDVRTPPDPNAEPVAPTTATRAVAVKPAGLVLPAVLPDGVYTATLDEVVGDDVADSLSFSFTVGTGEPPPPPNAPPVGGGGGGGPTDDLVTAPFQTIPLAPLPDLDDPEVIPDGPVAPEDADAPPKALPPLSPVTDEDVLRILILAIIAFTVMAMSGARGLGRPRRLIEAPVGASGVAPVDLAEPLTRDATMAVIAGLGAGELDGTDEDAGRARPFGDRWGDRSITWRFPGWPLVDGLSRRVPIGLAPRLPLFARISADGSYLRAVLGSLWALLPIAGLILGLVAALDDGAAPLPPGLGLVIALLLLAVLDSAAGIAAVLAFTAVTLSRGGLTAEGLSFAEGTRGLMGLAALWFVAPLVAAAARPLRRVAEPEHVYPWDRLGDTVIAALISGWAVQGIVGALGDLTDRELGITSHADGLALLTIGAVVGRFLLEESVAKLYPRRLHAVQEQDELPPPTPLQQVRGLVVR